jgi:hypothetical protein
MTSFFLDLIQPLARKHIAHRQICPQKGLSARPVVVRWRSNTGTNSGGNMFRSRLLGFAALVSAGVMVMLAAGSASAQVLAPKVQTPVIPANVDAFNLSFEDFKKYSTMKGFELVGQSVEEHRLHCFITARRFHAASCSFCQRSLHHDRGPPPS